MINVCIVSLVEMNLERSNVWNCFSRPHWVWHWVSACCFWFTLTESCVFLKVLVHNILLLLSDEIIVKIKVQYGHPPIHTHSSTISITHHSYSASTAIRGLVGFSILPKVTSAHGMGGTGGRTANLLHRGRPARCVSSGCFLNTYAQRWRLDLLLWGLRVHDLCWLVWIKSRKEQVGFIHVHEDKELVWFFDLW